MSRDRPSVHLDIVMIEAYAAQLVDAGAAASIERHLTCCEQCRATVATAGVRGDLVGLGAGRLDGIWQAVLEDIDAIPVAAPHRERHCLRTLRAHLRNLLAKVTIPQLRLGPWARQAVITAAALVALFSVGNASGSGSFLPGDSGDSMERGGAGDRATTVARTLPEAHLCPPGEVLFDLTWALELLTRAMSNVGAEPLSGGDSVPDQQRLTCWIPELGDHATAGTVTVIPTLRSLRAIGYSGAAIRASATVSELSLRP